MFVKGNHPETHAAIAELFTAAADLPPAVLRRWGEEIAAATVVETGHGRIERRTLASTTWLTGYLDWPDVSQVFRVERERRVRGRVAVEVAYGVTSRPRGRADAARLPGLVRAHRGIENRLHDVRDVTLREDACRVRSGSAPRVLASLRNVAVYLLAGSCVAGGTRRVAARPELAFPWLGLRS